MQALFYLLLFGFLVSIFVLFGVSVNQTAIMRKMQNVETTKQILSDVEVAVKQLLTEYPDFVSYQAGYDPDTLLSDPIDSYLTENSPWTDEDLLQDPWRNDYRVVTVQQGFALTTGVTGPAYAFALGSAGPDREWQTTFPGIGASFIDVLNVEAPAGSDDIIHTFSTRNVLQKNWNRVYDVLNQIEAEMKADYRQQYQQFLPTIDTYYRANSNTVFDSAYSLNDRVVAWSDGLPNGCSGSCALAPIAVSTSGYPVMTGDLGDIGANLAIEKLPSGFTIGIDQEINCITGEQCATATVTLGVGSPDWTISYNVLIDGRDLLKR
jgi:hypothetical protein